MPTPDDAKVQPMMGEEIAIVRREGVLICASVRGPALDRLLATLDAARAERDRILGAKSAFDVLVLLSESSGPDTGEPTTEMAAQIWALMSGEDASMVLLAVKAWERGQSFQKSESRALAAEQERDALAVAMEGIATAAEAGVSLIQALDAGVGKVEHPVRRMERIALEARAALAVRGKVR